MPRRDTSAAYAWHARKAIKAPVKGRLNFEWFGAWENVIGKMREVTSRTKKDEDTGEFKKYRVPGWSFDDEKGLGIKVWATFKGEDEPRFNVVPLGKNKFDVVERSTGLSRGARDGHGMACDYAKQLEKNADFFEEVRVTTKLFGRTLLRWTIGVAAMLVVFAYFGAQP